MHGLILLLLWVATAFIEVPLLLLCCPSHGTPQATQWVVMLLYLWTLVAPYILTSRDFD